MSEDVLAVESGVPVTSNLVEANLEIEDQEEGVVLVEPFPWDGCKLLVETVVMLGEGVVPSPRTALKRARPAKRMLDPNFMLRTCLMLG